MLLLDQLDLGLHVGLVADEFLDAAAGDALPQQAHAAVGEAQHLLDLDRGADLVDELAVVDVVLLVVDRSRAGRRPPGSCRRPGSRRPA